MVICGMCTAAGQRACDVDIPAKSAPSGGLLVAVPNYAGGGLFSLGLDRHGNGMTVAGASADA
jgi:glutaminase